MGTLHHRDRPPAARGSPDLRRPAAGSSAGSGWAADGGSDPERNARRGPDLTDIGLVARTRRGEIRAYARPDDALKKGEVFIPFCYHEAAANLLTNEALDPFGKIPEFKFCAIRLDAA